MKRFLFWLLLAALPLSGQAQDTRLRPLDRADEASAWWAVGRVNIGDDGYCTGTLIEVNVVLTAAHCFFDPYTNRRVPDSSIRFVAGFSDGAAQSIRGARKVVIDPGYDPRESVTTRNIAHDVALFELDQPILDSVIAPIATGPRPEIGSDVAIVSYGRGRDTRPSIQDVCTVTDSRGVGDTRHAVFSLTCDITFGSSGSAVLDLSGAAPRVVSVISSMRVTPYSKTAFSMNLAGSLSLLRPQLSIGVPDRKLIGAGSGGLPQAGSGLPQAGSGLPRTAGGLNETRSGLPEVREGLPATREGLPQIGN